MTRTRDPLPGVPARYARICPRCGENIAQGDRVVHQRGVYIHVQCASGQEDQ